ncbi:uncharacterized protein LOC129745072 isoform X2 [Uranotaenia lowii]|uniref:uncharacterized protein LOC129745072 isoform X2 n=1 Tax=Uranotaenia lowii TaxID=190385 RepID=UPI002478A703|nr:uncharacterized protein LOC129745072 isoform X2 [Uranotaenia lowii]
MVNKQYNVHNPKLHKSGAGGGPKSSPPPAMRNNYPEVSRQPNPPDLGNSGSLENNLNHSAENNFQRRHPRHQIIHQNNLDQEMMIRRQRQAANGSATPPSDEDFGEDGVYGRNISYYSENQQLRNESPTQSGNSVKNLTINDIGRFQYILEMDREVGSPYSGYTETASHDDQSPSGPNSLPNHLHPSTNRQCYNFWKVGSQTPLTGSSSINTFFRPSPHSRCCLWRALKLMWRVVKWPLALLMVCSLLGLVVYFLVVDRDIMSSSLLGENGIYNVEENLSIDFNDFTHTNDLGSGAVTTFGRDHKDKGVGFSKDGSTPNSKFSFGLNNDLLAIFVKKTEQNRNEGFWTSTERENMSEETPAQVVKVIASSSTTTRAPIRKTSTISLKDYTKSRGNFDDDEFEDIGVPSNTGEHTTRAIDAISHDDDDQEGTDNRNRQQVGSIGDQKSLNSFGFTSGHQNSFGVPIEDDEHLLRMLNEQLMKLETQREKNLTSISSTTDSSLYRTKVSPTLPILSRFEITTEGICKSTSLGLCRGVLPYDLTNSKNPRLTAVEYEHFQYLINSKCSVRVAEFVCLVLEPECRPTRMGTLTPCKRICKSILEPCAHIIASSEVLTATFDCDSYPDSNDRNVCEDPTRQSKCYANEFQCADSSCIPLQWKCDNIKDCQNGEDESDCKFCERDEYRCLSNDKCIPDKWRCDQYEDCPDASDELDCYYDEQTTYPTAFGSQREYPFVQVQVPNSPVNVKPYLTITNEDRERNQQRKQQEEEQQQQRSYGDYEASQEDEYEPTAAENVPHVNRRNRTDTVEPRTTERIEDQTEAETTRTISVPKSLSNFQDSKEIMMTSDSENDYKYSSTSRDFLTTAHASPCPEGELRCVSGICISVNQLCDRVADCPDGADEAMCVYKE